MYGGAKSLAGAYFRGLRPGKSRPTSLARRGGLEPADCAGVGFGAIRAGGFLPVKGAGGGGRRVLSRSRSLHPA